MADRVRSFGLTPDVEDILARIDVLLLTSRTESFGLAVLEAAACGVPAVAPRVGGLPEVIVDGVTGLLYEPGDEDAAVADVAGLLSDDRLRHLMGRAAVARARTFDREDVVSRYEGLYRHLVELRTIDGLPVPGGVATLADAPA